MEKRLVILVLASLIISLIIVVPATGEEYRIGPEDVLEIKFWQDPVFNTQTRVGQDGMITIDIIGKIQAAGKTTNRLQDDVVRQIARLNNKISQAVVIVVEYNYNHLFVTGQVKGPGKLTFEEIPDLWTIINEAGGITGVGDLSRVTIVRGGDKAGQVEVVDIREAISSGRLN
ncbi:MAG: polysaccharide biosynthesis/export family protein, partial [candidate division Zixibacteria bacterium]|nr:polysaccharide biosynthesis/export family protein [candidate division Zixibacteria bacterium]